MYYYSTFFMTSHPVSKAKKEVEKLRRIVFIRLNSGYYIGFCCDNQYKKKKIVSLNFIKELEKQQFSNQHVLLGKGNTEKLMKKAKEYIEIQPGGKLPLPCIGRGGYNVVYLMRTPPLEWRKKKTYDNNLAYKVQKTDIDGEVIGTPIEKRMNASERGERISGIVNSKKVDVMTYEDGLLMPLLSGREPEDKEFVHIIIKLFIWYNRIFVDPFKKNIFVTPCSLAVISDFDLILDLNESDDSIEFYGNYKKFMRKFSNYYECHGKKYPWAVEAILNLVYLVDQLLQKDSFVSNEVKRVLLPSLVMAVTPYRVCNLPIANEDLLRFSRKKGILDNIVYDNYFFNMVKSTNIKSNTVKSDKVKNGKRNFPNRASFHQVPELYDNIGGSSSSSDEDDDFPSYSCNNRYIIE